MEPRFLELCALDSATRLFIAWREERIAYLEVPFDRKVDAVARIILAKNKLDAGETFTPWLNVHELGAYISRSDFGGVSRAMRVALTPKQEKDPRAWNRIWCPCSDAGKKNTKGWVWIDEGVDPEKEKPTSNRGLILHVTTGMRIWMGYANESKPLLTALRKRHPDAFPRTLFGETPDDGPETKKVKETLREFGAL